MILVCDEKINILDIPIQKFDAVVYSKLDVWMQILCKGKIFTLTQSNLVVSNIQKMCNILLLILFIRFIYNRVKETLNLLSKTCSN